MKTEERDEDFREKLSGLDSPPPQVGWNQNRSWGKLEKQLARQSATSRKKIAWWVYAAAAIVLLIPALITVRYFNQQRYEIHRLETALAQTKKPIISSTITRDSVNSMDGDASNSVAPQVAKRPANHRTNQAKNQPGKKTSRSTNPQPSPMPVAEEMIAETAPMLTDTAEQVPTIVSTPATIAKIIRKGKKMPVARTIVFVFPGKEKSQDTQLADSSPKPARKFVFLSGEKEENTNQKSDDLPNPFLFTPKHKTTP